MNSQQEGNVHAAGRAHDKATATRLQCSGDETVTNLEPKMAACRFIQLSSSPPPTTTTSSSTTAVAGGQQELADQESDWTAGRLDQRPGDGGDPEDTEGALLGQRGQWQRQLGLESLWPCLTWSPM